MGLKKFVLTAIAFFVLVGTASAGPLTLGWAPIQGATSYEIEQSTTNGTSWTVVTPSTPVSCTSTQCTASIVTPTTGRPQYCIVSVSAGGRTRPQICIVTTDLAVNPPQPPPPPAPVDSVEAGR